MAAARRGSRELEPDTDAMVSHLRKMSPLNRHYADGARWHQRMSPLLPLSTGRDQDHDCRYDASAPLPARASWAKMTACTIRNIGTRTVGISDQGSVCTPAEPTPA